MAVNHLFPRRENLRGDKRGAVAKGKASGQDEAVATGEGHRRDDTDTGDGHGAEQERGHTAQHGTGDGNQRSGKLGEDAHDDEPEAASVSGLAVGAARESDDAVVLRERAHGRDGAEASDDAVQTVREDTTLDAGIEEVAIHFEAGHIAGGGDVADGFHGENHVDC